MDAMAVFPPYMYSSGSASTGSTKPLPTGTVTPRSGRSKAAVRFNSASTRSASPCMVGDDAVPA
jgi:hypothetical protein